MIVKGYTNKPKQDSPPAFFPAREAPWFNQSGSPAPEIAKPLQGDAE
jgi:hypothetical protein